MCNSFKHFYKRDETSRVICFLILIVLAYTSYIQSTRLEATLLNFDDHHNEHEYNHDKMLFLQNVLIPQLTMKPVSMLEDNNIYGQEIANDITLFNTYHTQSHFTHQCTVMRPR